MVPGLPETPTLDRTYTKMANNYGLVLSYYIIAFPWSLFIILFAVYLLIKMRSSILKPTYSSIILEGLVAGTIRMLEIMYVTPGCFLNASFLHSLVVYLDELAPVFSSCSSLFAFLVFVRIVEPKIGRFMTDGVATIIGWLCTCAFAAPMIWLTWQYDRAILDMKAEDIPDLIALLNRLEARIEPPLVGVSIAIMGLYFLMAIALAYKVFSVTTSGASDNIAKNKQMGRLLLLILVQLFGGAIGVAGSAMGISTQVATAAAPGVTEAGGVMDPELNKIAENSTFKLLVSFGLKEYGYLIMGTAQLVALNSSSSSSSSSAAAPSQA